MNQLANLPKAPKNNQIGRRRIVGLVRHIGNVVYRQRYQGFESLRLRQDIKNPPSVGDFLYRYEIGGQTR